MKKFLSLFILFAALLAAGPSPAVAQTAYLTYKTAADTTTNQDTTTLDIAVTRGVIKAAQITVLKVSGTQHGTVVLQGNIDGNWVSTSDTLTLSDQSVNTKIFTEVGDYLNYRALYITPSGTQKSLLKFSVLRHDER